MEKDIAILLRQSRYSEHSLIVTWLTRHHGLVKTLVRGALRPKSAFRGSLDLFFTCEIEIVRSKKSELHTLREAAPLSPRLGLRRDYGVIRMASYFAKLIDLAVEPDHEVASLFDLLTRALDWLAVAQPSRRGLVHFENSLAGELGIGSEEQMGWSALEEAGIVSARAREERNGILQALRLGT